MGTSTNQRSARNVPSWKLVRRVLGSEETPVDRQTEEIWRAVARDRDGQLEKDFASAAIAEAARIADSAREPAKAIAAFDEVLMRSNECGIAFDIARRALARAVASKEHTSGFAAELFVEAANYYVSRDLPSYVGAEGRVKTTSAAIALKDRIRDTTRRAVESIASTKKPANWSRYISVAMSTLQKRKRG